MRDDGCPEIGEFGHRLIRRFILFAAAIRQATNGESLSKKLGVKVTESQADAIRFLALNDNVTIGEMATGLGHTISGATKAVNRLEKIGWVERIHDGEDQRTVYVRLTQAGKFLGNELLSEAESRMKNILQKLRPETIDRLDRILEEFLTDFIDDERIAAKLCIACGFEGGINCCESNVDCVVAKTIQTLDNEDLALPVISSARTNV